MILQTIKQEEESFKKNSIVITKGYSFNQYDTIRRIILYVNDKYETDGLDDKVFWNLATPRLPHFAKNLDLDTKDLMPYGEGEINFYQSWVLRMKFQRWLEDSGFSGKLNDLAEGISMYGSFVFKKVKAPIGRVGEYDLEEVDLRNLYMSPTAKTLADSPFVIERHLLTEDQIRAKKDVWTDVEKFIEGATAIEQTDEKENQADDGTDVPFYEVFERWGYVEEDGDFVYKQYIVGDIGDEEEHILWQQDANPSDLPYKDFHIGKYKGRWLRVGVVERLFKLQERVNTLVNQNADTTEIASLLLMRSDDENIMGNVLDSVVTGEIINTTNLEQVPIDNRGLNNFLQELAVIERQADKLCFTPEVVTGDSMPSGTPFRLGAVLSNAGKSTFRFYKESIGEQLGELLKKDIMPGVVKTWNHGDIFELGSDEGDIEMYDNLLINKLKWKAYQDYFSTRGTFPSQEMMALLDARVREVVGRDNRKIEIEKDFFNFKWGIKMNVTGEKVDKAAKNETLVNALNMISGNPAIVQNPLFRQLLEDNGITPMKLDNKLAQAPAQAGGGQLQTPKRDKLMSELTE